MTDFHLNCQASTSHAENETGGNGKDIENNLVFEPGGVQEVDQPVAEKHESQRLANDPRPCQSRQQERYHYSCGKRHAQFTAGKRAVSLSRVQPVLFAVSDLVQQVDRAAGETKEHEGRKSTSDGAWRKKVLREKQRSEHKEILDPLLGPQLFRQASPLLESAGSHLDSFLEDKRLFYFQTASPQTCLHRYCLIE
jgi:hypothetical protein